MITKASINSNQHEAQSIANLTVQSYCDRPGPHLLLKGEIMQRWYRTQEEEFERALLDIPHKRYPADIPKKADSEVCRRCSRDRGVMLMAVVLAAGEKNSLGDILEQLRNV